MELHNILLNCTTTKKAITSLHQLIDVVNSKSKISYSRELVNTARRMNVPFYNDAKIYHKDSEAFVLGARDGLKLIISMTLAKTNPDPDSITTNLSYLVGHLEGFTEPKSPTLTKKQVRSLITQAQVNTGVIKLINRWQPLFVVIIPMSDKELDSFYLPGINTILSTAPYPDGGDAGYIFLHEVGHSLQLALTKDSEKVPESFLSVFEITFNNQIANVNPAHWPEIFADSFTMAVSYKTPLQKTNPLCQEFPDLSMAGLAAYFKMLIQANSNKDLSKPADIDWTAEQVNQFNAVLKLGPPTIEQFIQLLK